MGIDYQGGMIVGSIGLGELEDHFANMSLEERELFEDDVDYYIEEMELEKMSPYLEAESEKCYYGFWVDDVKVSDMDEEWLQHIKEKADRFTRLTGLEAKLIGTQDIY